MSAVAIAIVPSSHKESRDKLRYTIPRPQSTSDDVGVLTTAVGSYSSSSFVAAGAASAEVEAVAAVVVQTAKDDDDDDDDGVVAASSSSSKPLVQFGRRPYFAVINTCFEIVELQGNIPCSPL